MLQRVPGLIQSHPHPHLTAREDNLVKPYKFVQLEKAAEFRFTPRHVSLGEILSKLGKVGTSRRVVRAIHVCYEACWGRSCMITFVKGRGATVSLSPGVWMPVAAVYH